MVYSRRCFGSVMGSSSETQVSWLGRCSGLKLRRGLSVEGGRSSEEHRNPKMQSKSIVVSDGRGLMEELLIRILFVRWAA